MMHLSELCFELELSCVEAQMDVLVLSELVLVELTSRSSFIQLALDFQLKDLADNALSLIPDHSVVL